MPQLFTNNASGVLASLFDIGDTHLTLNSGQGAKFPLPTGGDYFIATVEDNLGNLEIIKVTTRAGDGFTVVERAQEGTTQFAFAAGSRVELRMTAATLLNFLQAIATVPQGGTGAASFTNHSLLVGRAAAALAALPALTTGQILVGVTGADPAAQSGATLRTTLGVGTGDSPTFTGLHIGTVDFSVSGNVLTISCGGETLAQFIKDGATLLYWNNIRKIAAGSVGAFLYSDTAIATPPVASPGNGSLTVYDADGTDSLLQFGFYGSTTVFLINQVRGAAIEIGLVDASGVYNKRVVLDAAGTQLWSAEGNQIVNLNDTGLNVGHGTLYQGGVPVSVNTHTHAGLVTKFQSSLQALATNGSVPHGLGGVPDWFQVSLVCVVDDAGTQYVFGDEIPMASSYGSSTEPNVAWAGLTDVGWAMNVINPGVNLKNTAAVQNINASKWQIVCRAFKIS